MDKETTVGHTMYQFDIEMLTQFFARIDRQGPGSDTETLKALHLIRNFLPARPRIADIGCGTGRQSMALAKAMACDILSLDLMPCMIKGVEERVAREHLANQITPIQGSMESLPFDSDFFDLIWSEGAIYNMGFERGLTAWLPYLKRGGFVVVTDASWLTDERPENAQWITDNFTEIDTIAHKVEIMQRSGYQPYGHFVLPERAWEENYYQPIERLLPIYKMEHPKDPTVQMLDKQLTREVESYRRYGHYYGYVFYIGQKM